MCSKQNASNAAVLGDCARHSLYVRTCMSCFKYWLKILHMQDDRFVKILCYLKMTQMGKLIGLQVFVNVYTLSV